MTKDEALKLALEALESSDELINGSGNHFGLEGAMDGYYSGCFDVGGNNKLLNKALTAIKEALAKEKALQALHDENERLGLYKDAYAEQEPVAWWNDTGTHIDLNVSGRGTPLYTTPPQRKPLTDEHPLVVFAKECVLGAYKESELGDAARRAIEAAYNIKGEA